MVPLLQRRAPTRLVEKALLDIPEFVTTYAADANLRASPQPSNAASARAGRRRSRQNSRQAHGGRHGRTGHRQAARDWSSLHLQAAGRTEMRGEVFVFAPASLSYPGLPPMLASAGAPELGGARPQAKAATRRSRRRRQEQRERPARASSTRRAGSKLEADRFPHRAASSQWRDKAQRARQRGRSPRPPRSGRIRREGGPRVKARRRVQAR